MVDIYNFDDGSKCEKSGVMNHHPVDRYTELYAAGLQSSKWQSPGQLSAKHNLLAAFTHLYTRLRFSTWTEDEFNNDT